eukprot:CAMPEP_0116550926 /NCGR_PEP_ID=MMETSP0397-20121206/5686_1 /TAXON_ID=216820 /ORGANISM="Cyclophora tenuis, Strain ECT3854" /LENGTH=57 /DNA_ID=CAMNT_0004075787 /DNA_START=793 /DNA_END=963 /DNA_ORIENTATION=-
MNGLSTVGSSLAKGIGPVFAGLLVAFCLSSGLFSPQFGATLIFVVFSAIGLFIATLA